jgi:6-phosphogluconate dehydrogenase
MSNKYAIGMVGLGVMGRNLALNMADHGFSVVGYDKDHDMVRRLNEEAADRQVRGFQNLEEFVAALQTPHSVMMMVPAGAPVDAVIHDLLPHLEEGDLIIDGGNSHFSDTDLRGKSVAEKGILYLGVGISGGESGARHGPSMMPGGSEEAYQRVQAIFEATAAKVQGEPCVVYLGPGSAGHYVKMVHNGIEYGIMQLIAETYDLMKRGLNLSDEELHQVYKDWNQTEVNSYLVEITAAIFNEVDEQTGKRLIDVILDEAKQKGTGMWTSQDAMNLQVPVPTIDIAVAMRNLSALKPERREVNHLMDGGSSKYLDNRSEFIEQVRKSLYAGMIITYAQGFNQLYRASVGYKYHLDLQEVARIWRGGCIIRSALLNKIRSAFQKNPDLTNLLLDIDLGRTVLSSRDALKIVVQTAAEIGVPTPGLMVSLGYLDGYRSAWLPANLIQAQRDYFGSHTYERIDARGVFHTKWENS